MFCPGCGAENPDDAKYCQNCAKRLDGVLEEFEKDNTAPVLRSSDNVGHQSPRYVGFWRRFGAFAIDIVVIYIIYLILSGALGFILGVILDPVVFEDVLESAGISLLLLFIFSAIFVLYFASLESSKAQGSFGKQFAKIVVVDESDRRLNSSKGMLRAIGKFGSFIIFGLGFLLIPFSDSKNSLHDMIAGTRVIYAQK